MQGNCPGALTSSTLCYFIYIKGLLAFTHGNQFTGDEESNCTCNSRNTACVTIAVYIHVRPLLCNVCSKD